MAKSKTIDERLVELMDALGSYGCLPKGVDRAIVRQTLWHELEKAYLAGYEEGYDAKEQGYSEVINY